MGNARALSLRNIVTIFEKQRLFLSCPDWLAEGASVFFLSHAYRLLRTLPH